MLNSITANLMAESVSATKEFYQDMLGFSEVTSVPDEAGGLQFAIVQRDACLLMFQERQNLGEEYPCLATDKVRPGITLYIKVNDFAGFYAEVKGKVRVLHDVHTTFYGSREFAFADNNGYVLTIAENV
ncbi:MAG: VOC family protein [Propionibacteriaceae bacterium]|nr:VOC family protein [Propionibacteriaceae bacterium]